MRTTPTRRPTSHLGGTARRALTAAALAAALCLSVPAAALAAAPGAGRTSGAEPAEAARTSGAELRSGRATGARQRSGRTSGAEPGRLVGAEVVKTGWWWVANEPPPETGVVAAQKPPSPTTPAGTLPVGAAGGEEERVSALEFALEAPAGSSVRRFELAVRESTTPGANAGAEVASLVACPVTELFWADGQGAAWRDRPVWDCELGRAEGVRDEEGVWRFDLAAIASGWAAEGFVGSRSVVLVEEVEAPESFQVALDGPRLEGVGVLARTVAPSGAGEDGEGGDEAGGGADPVGATGTGTGAGSGTVAGPGGGGGDLDAGGAGAPVDAGLPPADGAPVDGAVDDAAVASSAAAATSTDSGATGTQAAATPVAATPSWWSGLPWAAWLLVPVALVVAYLVMLSLGPDGRPLPGGGERRGVGRALETMRRLRSTGVALRAGAAR